MQIPIAPGFYYHWQNVLLRRYKPDEKRIASKSEIPNFQGWNRHIVNTESYWLVVIMGKQKESRFSIHPIIRILIGSGKLYVEKIIIY